MPESEKPKTLGEALLRFQEKAVRITKDQVANVPTKGGGSYKYTYLSLEKLLEEVLPQLNELGLVWVNKPMVLADGQTPGLHYQLLFVGEGAGDGPVEAIEGVMPLMIRQGGPQDLGAALSYARRYALLAVLNLAPDKDEDGQTRTQEQGQARGSVKKLTKAAAQRLAEKAERTGVEPEKLRLAGTRASGEDVGPCDTKAQAVAAMQKLTQEEATKVSDWLDKVAEKRLADEAGDGADGGEES